MITEYTAGCAAAGIHGGRTVEVTGKYPDKTLSRCHLSRVSSEEMMFRSRSTPKTTSVSQSRLKFGVFWVARLPRKIE